MTMTERLNKLKCVNALQLKILAMALMLCDHTWYTIASGWGWLTAIGRLAFPIFAFQIAEGFYHTKDRKRYFLRMLVFALISEIPFNLMVAGTPIFPLHQNVMFTFCISLLTLMWMEWAKQKGTLWFAAAVAGGLIVGFLVGTVTLVDYYGFGVWMVVLFYLCRDIPFGWAIELVAMWYINWELLGGLVYLVPVFGRTIEIPRQGLAVLALIPIWLYNGKQGHHSRAIQYAGYAFYPAHLLILGLLAMAGVYLT